MWAVVRMTASALAARLDFSFEDIEDLRLAVTELCGSCATGASAGATCECEFDLSDERIELRCSVAPVVESASPDETHGHPLLDRLELSKQILNATVDSFAIDSADDAVTRGFLRKLPRSRGPPGMKTEDRGPASEQLLEFAETRDPKLRSLLIEEHLYLVERLARRFADRGEPLDDLVQAGSIGLINSVDRFDPEIGMDFVAYATTSIIGELKRHFRDRGWSIRASRRVQELYLELGPNVEILTQRFGRSPTIREIAAEIGTTEDAVLEAMEAGYGYRSPSLDAPGPEGGTIGDRLGETDHNMDLVDSRETIIPELAALPERERRLITMRFMEDLSQVEIADRLGISQMHVSRLLARSLAKLHRAVETSA